MEYEKLSKEELADLKERALSDIWAFADLIDFRGGQKNFYQLHRDMADMNTMNQRMHDTKREYRRRIFLVPREHFKSTVNTVLYTLWRVYRNPDIRIVIMCNVKELALDMIREIRAYLEDTYIGEWVWNKRPHIKGPLIPKLRNASSNYKRSDLTEAEDSKVIWTAWALQVVRELKDKQPTIQALSVGMRPTGKHCDLVIFDDIVDWDNSKTPHLAEKVRKSAAEIESVVTKQPKRTEICPGFEEWVGNEILINGTRYYEWDYYSTIVGNTEEEQMKRLAVRRYNAMVLDVYKNGVDNTDGYICPEIINEEVERDLLTSESITLREWYAQYRNKIINDTDQCFDPELVSIVPPQGYQRTSTPAVANYLDTQQMTPNGPKVYPIRLHMMVDLSVGKQTSDDVCITVGGFDELSRLHIVDCRMGKYPPNTCFEKIHDLADKWGLTVVNYEGGIGYQDSFRTSLANWEMLHEKRRLFSNPLPVRRDISKEERIVLALDGLLKARNLYIAILVWKDSNAKKEIRTFNKASKRNADNFLDTCEMLVVHTKPMLKREVRGKKDMGRHARINTVFGGVR